MKNLNDHQRKSCAGYLNEWLGVLGVFAILLGLAIGLPGKWRTYLALPLLGLFVLSFFMAWLDDPKRIAKKQEEALRDSKDVQQDEKKP